VQIRQRLQGYTREPQPTQKVLEDMETVYTHIVAVWERNQEIRNRRTNIIHLNLVITELILLCGGQEMYDAHRNDFTHLGAAKWTELYQTFCDILVRIGHLPRCPVRPIAVVNKTN
jgi:hypothetical protein